MESRKRRAIILILILGIMAGCRATTPVKEARDGKRPAPPAFEQEAGRKPAPPVRGVPTPGPQVATPPPSEEERLAQLSLRRTQRIIERMRIRGKEVPREAVTKLEEARKSLGKEEFVRVRQLCREVRNILFPRQESAVERAAPKDRAPEVTLEEEKAPATRPPIPMMR